MLGAATAVVFAASLLAGDTETPPHGLTLMTRTQVSNEMLRLQQSRPSLFQPVVLVAGGAPAAGLGVVFLNLGAALVFSKPALVGTFLLVGGAVFLLGGATAAIVGIVQIGRRLAARRALEVEIQELDQRLRQIERLEDHGWVTLATF